MQTRHEMPNWWNAELRSSSVGRVRGRNNHLRAAHQCWVETSNSPAGMDPEIEVTCLWWGACLCKARKGERWMILILTILDLRVYWRSTTSSGCFILVKVSWNRSDLRLWVRELMCEGINPLDPQTAAVKPGLLSRSLRRTGGCVKLLTVFGHLLFLSCLWHRKGQL